MNVNNSLVIFQEKQIRRKWHNSEWYFSVVDVIQVLTNQSSFQLSRNYWKVLKSRLNNEGSELVTRCNQLKLKAEDGKFRLTDTANTETLLRLIQSIPSPKAEPFKLWLAQVGKERLDEIENPELSQERAKQIYEQKGYSKDWIEKRLRGIAIRQGLTDEWKERGINKQTDYAILTSEISKATFGMTPSEYRKLKQIPSKSKINLRDNMTDLELIFTMLGERVTTEISKNEKPKAFNENKKVANRAGSVAGRARLETEKEIGKSIITKQNYLK
ncbi:MAG: Bro-N domain-containing protein [Patescibacteria group bacterium]